MLELSGQNASGQGVSTDIIEAAALAYIRALSNVEGKVAAIAAGQLAAMARERAVERADSDEVKPTARAIASTLS